MHYVQPLLEFLAIELALVDCSSSGISQPSPVSQHELPRALHSFAVVMFARFAPSLRSDRIIGNNPVNPGPGPHEESQVPHEMLS